MSRVIALTAAICVMVVLYSGTSFSQVEPPPQPPPNCPDCACICGPGFKPQNMPVNMDAQCTSHSAEVCENHGCVCESTTGSGGFAPGQCKTPDSIQCVLDPAAKKLNPGNPNDNQSPAGDLAGHDISCLADKACPKVKFAAACSQYYCQVSTDPPLVVQCKAP